MINLKPEEPDADPASSALLPEANNIPRPPLKFPSPLLIIANVLSCFLATVSLASALTLIVDPRWPWFVVPGGAGFVLTIPYHTYLYVCLKRHHRAQKEAFQSRPPPTMCLALAYLLASVWGMIFFFDVLYWLQYDWIPLAAKITTIITGVELITFSYVALKCTLETWRLERLEASYGHLEPPPRSGETLISDEATLNQIPNLQQPPIPSYMSFVSIIFATLSLMFAITIRMVSWPITPFMVANIAGFTLTAPYHAISFVSSGRTSTSDSLSCMRKNVLYALFLFAVWCAVFVVDIFARDLDTFVTPRFHTVGSTITGGVECLVVGYLAIRCALDRFII